MERKILKILEKDARVNIEDISDMLDIPEETVAKIIDKLLAEKIICGFNTSINWENTSREFVTALIEVKVSPQSGLGYDKIAKRIYEFDEVKSVYLMSGVFDLTVIVEGKNIKDVSFFVSDKLSTLDEVLGVSTHFVLKKYKDHGVIFEKNTDKDERMIVSP